MIEPAETELLISARNSGKEVSFAPNLREEGKILKQAARHFYYPMLAMKHLQALASARP